jgi:PAS domain-containing protein
MNQSRKVTFRQVVHGDEAEPYHADRYSFAERGPDRRGACWMTDESTDLLERLRTECAVLRERLQEAEQTLAAFRRGDMSIIEPEHAGSSDTPQHTGEQSCLRLSETPELSTMDQALSLSRARLAALNLMEGAIAARTRSEDIARELQREIDSRLQAEAALVDSERRYRRIVEAIGDVYWLSTADWQTILYFDPSERPVKTGQRSARSSH